MSRWALVAVLSCLVSPTFAQMFNMTESLKDFKWYQAFDNDTNVPEVSSFVSIFASGLLLDSSDIFLFS